MDWLGRTKVSVYTRRPPVMPAPALMFTVVSTSDCVVSVPPVAGWAASQSTLPVFSPWQAASAPEAQAIAANDTEPSSAPRHIPCLPPYPPITRPNPDISQISAPPAAVSSQRVHGPSERPRFGRALSIFADGCCGQVTPPTRESCALAALDGVTAGLTTRIATRPCRHSCG